MLVHNAATSSFRGNEAAPACSRPFLHLNWRPVLVLAVRIYLQRHSWAACKSETAPLLCHCCLIRRMAAAASTSTASSIEMSSIASTLGRRDTGLGSAEIGYDEERAEPHSRAFNGNNSSWMPSCHSPVLYSGANNCRVDSVYLLLLRKWISYLSFTFKPRSSNISSSQQVQFKQTQRLIERSRSFHLLSI